VHDTTLAEVLDGIYTTDRSHSDFVLAKKCAFYNLTEAESESVLQNYGTKAKTRGKKVSDHYITLTVRAAFSKQDTHFIDLSNPAVQDNIREIKRLNSQSPLRGVLHEV